VTYNNKIINRINNITSFPSHYQSYNKEIIDYLYSVHQIATKSREKGLDPSSVVETEIAFDLADRVERMFDIPLAERLRELLNKEERTEPAALQLAEEVSLGKFGYLERNESLEKGVRVGLAVVTDGITVAPLQGISSVQERKNEDGSDHISVSFAGPIRSAGGTEAAFTLVIADHIRKTLGLGHYKVNGYGDDEVGRYIEELRIYEREVSNFQFRVSDDDIKHMLTHIPVEVDGVETDQAEIVVHHGLHRIKSDKVRGGALRVINDGLIGRSRKLFSLVKDLSIPGWDWLSDLEGGLQQDTEETKAKTSHFQDVISGRPVFSMPDKKGGFRLRYGRSYNTGLSAIGIHPIIPIILDHAIVVGTQAKLNLPGKAGIISFVDTIEPPIVLLKDGSVMKVTSSNIAINIKKKIDKILHLGDVLISYGDFLENNAKLPMSGYVEEWWAQDLAFAIKEKYNDIIHCSKKINIDNQKLKQLVENPFIYFPSIQDSIRISTKLNIPLHPRYLYYWNNVNISQILLLRQNITTKLIDKKNYSLTLSANNKIKNILENIGIPHRLDNGFYLIEGEDAYSTFFTLGLKSKINTNAKWKNIEELLSSLSGLTIKRKKSIFIGLRMGRPEKANIRKMKPPVHVLFPISNSGGIRRDIIKASKDDSLKIEIITIICPICKSNSLGRICNKCGEKTVIIKTCPRCKREIKGKTCGSCKINGLPYSYKQFPLQTLLSSAIKKIGYIPRPPLKGVKVLMNSTRIAEPLEKGILRNKHNLSIYRDGTIRFDTTNAPLTHFRPNQINTSIIDLIKKGYKFDIHGEPLKKDNQILELFVQDIIIPESAKEHLLNTSNFLDELLVKFYDHDSYYNLKKNEDLLGHLVVGLAPHTSVGIIGRIIGFTKSHVCYAHPLWHSAKRRDCDGDEDTIILLLDVLLNFSKEYLPIQIGGLMDAPLLIQPIIIPKEVQRQAHNIDIMNKYPLDFYKATLEEKFPKEISNVMEIVRNRLDGDSQFYNFYFTHDTNVLSIDEKKCQYSTLKTLNEKLDMQIEIAKKINAVNPNEVVSSVLNTHLLPDLIGNMKAYTSQSFRCKKCGKSHRRFPLKPVCTKCGGELQATVTRGSVEKYLKIALTLSETYDVDNYLYSRLKLISEELKSLFPIKEEQLELTQYLENKE
jgi:DNA polymerase II large subunit|tara:strand:+ start:3123 stop:6596 length:3474 start_codon:yes stop_codon:yes gene_type:complete